MLKHSISPLLAAAAIALSATSLTFSRAVGQPGAKTSLSFVCATGVEPVTTFVYQPNRIALTPVLSWYSDYLLPGATADGLCQQVGEKLQRAYTKDKPVFLAYQKVGNRFEVCLVEREGEECNSASSEPLFSLNAKYLKTPECVMDNKKPEDCTRAVSGTRGTVLSIPGGRYKPSWWVF